MSAQLSLRGRELAEVVVKGSESESGGMSVPLVGGVVVVKKGRRGRLGRGAKREDDVFMGPAVRDLYKVIS
jgi:hypothetical protein